MLDLGVIWPSQSTWASPVVLIPKPDGEINFCVDYSKLNMIMVQDSYAMPRIDVLLEKLGGATYIYTIDLTKGFWQIKLEKKPRQRLRSILVYNRAV